MMSKTGKMEKKINGFYKMGRLKVTIAKKIGVKSADIYIDASHLHHIATNHAKELKPLGIDAESYVRMIVNQYNMILKGSGTSILLVIYTEDLNHVAAIDLNYSIKKNFWEVKTAQPRRNSEIERKEKLWQNCPSSQ